MNTTLPPAPEDSVMGMDLRTKVCLWIILIGLANFLAYAVSYSIIGGEAVLGEIEKDPDTGKLIYHLQPRGKPEGVHRDMFVYSGIHGISIWPTSMALLLSMLTLAKDRIISSMRSTILSGRSVITVIAVVISVSFAGMTFLFVRQFASNFQNIKMAPAKSAPTIPGAMTNGIAPSPSVSLPPASEPTSGK